MRLMRRKQGPPGLASVSKLPGRRRPGPPYKTLSSAVARSAPERDVFVLLRKRLAARIDAGDAMSPAAMAALIRQFRDVDAKIRGIDAAAEEATAAADSGDAADGQEASWDPSKL
jgi:hypothetical protein